MTNAFYSFIQIMETEKTLLITPAPMPAPNHDFADELKLFFESIQLYLITSGKPIILWGHPCRQTDTTGYLPDKRIKTHKLIGKPSSGLSPPEMPMITETSFTVDDKNRILNKLYKPLKLF